MRDCFHNCCCQEIIKATDNIGPVGQLKATLKRSSEETDLMWSIKRLKVNLSGHKGGRRWISRCDCLIQKLISLTNWLKCKDFSVEGRLREKTVTWDIVDFTCSQHLITQEAVINYYQYLLFSSVFKFAFKVTVWTTRWRYWLKYALTDTDISASLVLY